MSLAESLAENGPDDGREEKAEDDEECRPGVLGGAGFTLGL